MDRYIYVCCSEGCPWWMISTKWSSRRYIDLADWKNGVRSFLGRSKEGVYFAATDDAKLRVWMFTESCDQTGHRSNLSMVGQTLGFHMSRNMMHAPSSWIIGYSAQRTRCHYNKMFAYRRRLGRWRRGELLLFLCQIPRVPSVQGGRLIV
jgi:hypothetical protein